MRTYTVGSIVLPLALLVLTACDSGTTDPPPTTPPTPVDTMPVLGHGLVNTRYTAEVAVRGEWAYTSTWGNRAGRSGDAVFVWNVGGNVPVLTDSIIIGGAHQTGDVQISDDGALLVVATEFQPGSIVLFERSNPANPTRIGAFTSANTQQGVHTVKLGRVNGRHYAFLSINPGTVPAKLVIVDITDAAAPAEVLAREMGRPFVHDTFVRAGLLFTALWHDGVTIWDIGGGGRGGTPSNPVAISSFVPTDGYIHNIWWYHGEGSARYLFLGSEGPGITLTNASGDIHVIDISDVAQPTQVARYHLPGAGTHNFSMDEASGILYAAYYNGGVRALDVRGNLGDCTAAQRTLTGECNLRLMGREKGVALGAGRYVWGVAYQDQRVYASDMLTGLYVIDATSLQR